MVPVAPLALLTLMVLQVRPVRVRLSVPANVAPCILRAPLPSQVDVRRWQDGLEWVHGLVARLVLVVCLVVLPLVLHLPEPLRAPAHE